MRRPTLADTRFVESSLSENKLYVIALESSVSPKLVRMCWPSDDTACDCHKEANVEAVDYES